MHAMDFETGGEVVGNGRGRAAINGLNREGVGVGEGGQVGLLEED